MDADSAQILYRENLTSKYFQLIDNDIPSKIREATRLLRSYVQLDISDYPDELVQDLENHLKSKKFTIKYDTDIHEHGPDTKWMFIRF